MTDFFQDRYRKLNEKQREAVDHIDGPLLVVAGPGSGKTELLGVRTANILNKTDTPLGSILCLTFTDTASFNMRERIIGLIGEDGYRIPIHTFHSFCVETINRYPEFFHKGASFRPADEAVKISILQKIIKDMDEEDPLSSYHKKEGYIYLHSVRECISLLKEGGVSPEEFSSVLEKNEEEFSLIEEEFSFLEERVTKSSVVQAEQIAEKMTLKEDKDSFFRTLYSAVGVALYKAVDKKNTTALSELKSKMLVRSDEGKHILKERAYAEKMKSLSFVYKKYEEIMHEEGYYDFDDMILDVISVLKKNEALRFTLQEKYLYLMIDEFQDTSGVQQRLLELLADNKVNEGMPNICAVGDDDQAIYRFQGADISNIMRFKDRYRNVKVVTLTDNYRSAQNIIDMSARVMEKGEERLENIIPEVSKKLKAAKVKKKGNITIKRFDTEEEEYSFVSSQVEKMIKEDSSSDIAVISRLHKSLRKALPYFNKKGVPVFYQRSEDILNNPQVWQIISILRFSASLLSGKEDLCGEGLSEIISYPFWGISRERLWKLSVDSHRFQRSWMSCMKDDPELSKIRDFLLDLGVRSRSEPAETLVDVIIGTKEGTMKSPFKDYYFSEDRFNCGRAEYLELLSVLRSLFRVLREHKEGRVLKAEDVINFIDLCTENNIPLSGKSSYSVSGNNVSLITSHGAKGMEFDTVFVLNCQDEIWNKNRGRRSMLPFPINLPLKRAGDSDDDRLRVFYVTLTRAKKNLFLTSHKESSGGRKNTLLRFMSEFDSEDVSLDKKEIFSVNEEERFFPITDKNEKKLLLPLVEKYKLSPTGLCAFLDLKEGGPKKFFEETVLRFPKKKALPLSFGTAMHSVITEAYMKLKKEGSLPDKEEVSVLLKEYLLKERLSEEDMKKCLKKGERALRHYITERKDSFSSEAQIERSFRNQGCAVSGVEITGKIDKLVTDNEKISIFDFKTGRALTDWKGKDDYDKIKAWRYKKQLLFYKILVESSEEFKGSCFVEKGVLEFLEPYKGKIRSLSLYFDEEETKRTKELIKRVGEMIKALHFPEISGYKKNFKGVISFEEDIIKGKV